MYLKKCIHNNIVAFKMNFIQEYISETKVSDSDEIETTEVTYKDSSKHIFYIYLY